MSTFYRPHPRYITPTGSVSMTKQSHKDECDINLIIKRYQKTGIIQHITSQTPIYTDLPDTLDYQHSLAVLQEAEDAFATLPSVVREHFSNDPAAFLAAFSDPAQHAQLKEWGLLNSSPGREPDPMAQAEGPLDTSQTK